MVLQGYPPRGPWPTHWLAAPGGSGHAKRFVPGRGSSHAGCGADDCRQQKTLYRPKGSGGTAPLRRLLSSPSSVTAVRAVRPGGMVPLRRLQYSEKYVTAVRAVRVAGMVPLSWLWSSEREVSAARRAKRAVGIGPVRLPWLRLRSSRLWAHGQILSRL